MRSEYLNKYIKSIQFKKAYYFDIFMFTSWLIVILLIYASKKGVCQENYGPVVELANTAGLKSAELRLLWVRLPPGPPFYFLMNIFLTLDSKT